MRQHNDCLVSVRSVLTNLLAFCPHHDVELPSTIQSIVDAGFWAILAWIHSLCSFSGSSITQEKDNDEYFSMIMPFVLPGLLNELRFKFRWEQSNKSIPKKDTEKKGLIVTWELAMARTIKQKAREQALLAETRTQATSSRPLVVGLVGIPGSGKTSSAEILSSLLPESCVLPMDGYHLSKAQLRDLPNAADALYRRGAPDTFNPVALQSDLHDILHSTAPTVSFPGFDHAKGDPEENKHTFRRDRHKIVICEGIYLTHDNDGWENIRSYFDYIIYINADIDTCIDRLKVRNKVIPGYSPEEIEKRCDEVDRVNAHTVEKSRKYATVEVQSGFA